MTDSIEIKPSGPLRARVQPPGSKSITNRALVCAALAEGVSTLEGALDSEDTQVMIDSLRQLGIAVDADLQASRLVVHGCGGRLPMSEADLYVANSGTTIRFLTAMVALGHGTYRLDGVPRMRQRPIADLLQTLTKLGASARSETGNDCPPVVIETSGLVGGKATVAGNISSQFLSGLLMAAPYAARPVELVVEGTLVSVPYVAMTLRVMESFGVSVGHENYRTFCVGSPQHYRGIRYRIEPDASAASYFWAAAAVTGGSVTVVGLSKQALQGDVRFCECLAQMGCRIEYDTDSITVHGGSLRGVDVKMNDISDTVQTLAVVALFADGPTAIRDVAHIRHKETDRIGDLARELRKLGAHVDENDDGLIIVPGKLRAAAIDTYRDHRMAMSFAIAGLHIPGIQIRDPACTSKTYPRFFEDLASLHAR